MTASRFLTVLLIAFFTVSDGSFSPQTQSQQCVKSDQTYNATCPINDKFRNDVAVCQYSYTCDNNTRAGEESVCQQINDHSRVYICRKGMWTSADVGAISHSRPKRWWFIPVVAVFVCLIWCRRPPPPPPPKPPRFTSCPRSMTVTALSGQTEARATWTEPKAVDDDSPSPSVSRISGRSPGSLFNQGDSVITYQARDSSSLSTYCRFTVTVKVTYCSAIPYSSKRKDTCTYAMTIYGSTCSFSCEVGYTLVGTSSTTCQSNGKWSSAFPSCAPVSCGDPGIVEGGTISCPHGTTYPNSCIISCKPGYQNSGLPYITCTSKGVFSLKFPCYDVEPPKFVNGCPSNQNVFSRPLQMPALVTWTDPKVTDNSGQNVKLTSSLAKESLLGPGPHVIKLTASDATGNSDSCIFLMTVIVRECKPLSPPINGRVACSHGYVEGSKCNVSCNEGYSIDGNSTLRCTDQELWDTQMSSCKAVPCPNLPEVRRGVFVCTGKLHFPTSCILTCDPGFQLQNNSEIQCLANGSWSNPGSCVDNEPPVFVNGCPGNIEISAGRIGNKTLVRWDTPHVTDNSGDAISLVSDRTSGSPFPVGVTYVTYTATDASENNRSCQFSVTVTVLICDGPDLELPNRTNTLMIYTCPDGNVYGASCTINCTHGYPLIGANTITCERDYATFPPRMYWDWPGPSAVVPVCSDVKCPDLALPQNGALACFLGNFGWDCLMSCNALYDIPAIFDGHYYCTKSSGIWIPHTVRDCVVRIRPGYVRLQSDVFYYAGSCNMSMDVIRQSFITRMNNSTFKDACIDVPLCTVDNVQVTCGPSSRKKRKSISDNLHTWTKRATTYLVSINFQILITYNETGRTAVQAYEEFQSKKNTIFKKLNNDFEAGGMDISGLTRTDFGFGYPQVQGECPLGTSFHEDLTKTTFSCKSCGKGYYMNSATSTCYQCPVGTYSDVENATSCTSCPNGWSTSTTASQASSECNELCLAGHTSYNGFVPCQPCSPGHFQNLSGSTKCQACPAGTWTLREAATNLNQCIPADANIMQNESLSFNIGSGWTALTLTVWIRSSNDTISVFSFDSGGPGLQGLKLFVDTGHISSMPQNISFSNVTIPISLSVQAGSWSRLLLVINPLNANTSIYHNDRLVSSMDQATISNLTTSTWRIDVMEGKVVVSGLHAASLAKMQEEISKNATHCSGDVTNNILTWAPTSTNLVVPSLCDAADECQQNPCGKHQCENLLDGYICHCQDGWKGVSCSIPPDVCDTHGCQNGASCLTGVNNYTCVCVAGFTGNLCELELINGQWGDWSAWSTCTVTCGGGSKQRSRSCINPPPQNGGQNCTDTDFEIANCSNSLCPVNGMWSSWGAWGACSETCGGGQRRRLRDCNNPAPLNEGSDCAGVGIEQEVCDTESCPVIPSWGVWAEWTSCSVTCGSGQRSRGRMCINLSFSNSSESCIGSSNETSSCDLGTCPACAALVRSKGTVITCNVTGSPYLKMCNVSCAPGYTSADIFPLYTCGEESGYLWNHQKDHNSSTLVPGCSIPKSPSRLQLQQNVSMNTAYDVSTASAVETGVKSNMKTLPCVQQGVCDVNVSTGLAGAATRTKRESQKLQIFFTLTVNFEGNSPLNESDPSSTQRYLEVLQLAEESGALVAINQTETLFTLVIGDKIILPDMSTVTYKSSSTCPAGSVDQYAVCVDCPEGTKEVNGQCVRCPLGQYQDQPGSTYCKVCPWGMSWDTEGALHISQCLFPLSMTTSFTPDNDNGNDLDNENTGRIIGVVFGAVGLLAVAAGFLIYIFKQKNSNGTNGRSASIISLNTVT